MGRRGLRRGSRGTDAVHRLVAAALTAGALALPAAAARADRIAASRDGGGIAVLSGARGGVVGRIGRSTDAVPVAVSRDGRRLLYTRGESVWISRVDGSHARRVIARGALHPALSPNGRYIAYTRFECAPRQCIDVNNPSELFLLDLRSGKTKRLTQNGEYDGDPEWSPDGGLLLFAREQGLFTMTPDGRNVHTVVGGGLWMHPRWSPNGHMIAFDDFRDVHVLDLTNGRVLRMTRNPGPDHTPAWSRDGTRLAYLSEHVCGTCYSAHDPWEVWVLEVRSRKTWRVSGKGFLSPVWLPAK